MLAELLLTAAANVTASVISLRRELVRHTLTDDECEKAGVPYESTERAVYLMPLEDAPWWHFAVYVRRVGSESCVDLRGFALCAEVWHLPR